MLYTFLLVLLVIDSFVLIAAILLQSGKGGGLAASFGGAQLSPMRSSAPARPATCSRSELVGRRDLPRSRVHAAARCRRRSARRVGARARRSARQPANVAPPPTSAPRFRSTPAPTATAPTATAPAGGRRRPNLPPTLRSGKLTDRRANDRARVPPPRGRNPFSWPARAATAALHRGRRGRVHDEHDRLSGGLHRSVVSRSDRRDDRADDRQLRHQRRGPGIGARRRSPASSCASSRAAYSNWRADGRPRELAGRGASPDARRR